MWNHTTYKKEAHTHTTRKYENPKSDNLTPNIGGTSFANAYVLHLDRLADEESGKLGRGSDRPVVGNAPRDGNFDRRPTQKRKRPSETDKHLYEEFIRLAETRLAQNSLTSIKIA